MAMASNASPTTPTEKQFATSGKVTVAEVETPITPSASSPFLKDNEKESSTKIKGAVPDLLYGALLPCIPVVVVSASLLALIFYHRVQLDSGWESLQAPTKENVYDSKTNRIISFTQSGGSHAYYIRFNPAILAAIASWTSKIIPFITGASMAVVAFFAGRRILDATKGNQPEQLPTPHQMSILISLLGGNGIAPLRDTMLYRWQNHERLAQPIPMAFGALSFIVFIT